MIECIADDCGVNPHVSYYDHDSARRVWNRRSADEIEQLRSDLALRNQTANDRKEIIAKLEAALRECAIAAGRTNPDRNVPAIVRRALGNG